MIDNDQEKQLQNGNKLILAFYKWVQTTIEFKNGEKKSAP